MKSDHSEKYFLELAKHILTEEELELYPDILSVKSTEKLQALNARSEVLAENLHLAYIEVKSGGDMWLIDCEQVFMAWDTDILQNAAEVVAVTITYLLSWFASRHREEQPSGPGIFSKTTKQQLDRVSDLDLGEQQLLAAKLSNYMWGYVKAHISEIHDPEIIKYIRPYGVIPHDFVGPPPLD